MGKAHYNYNERKSERRKNRFPVKVAFEPRETRKSGRFVDKALENLGEM